jgi:hypothetical protein
MKKLLMLLFWGSLLLVVVAPLSAQNSVDVVDGGPQPPDAPMKAIWSPTSNASPTPQDIASPIVANFVFASGGAALPTDVPAAVKGQICLVDAAQTPAPTLFSQMAANCQAMGAIAVLIFDVASQPVTAPSAIPVFSMAGTDGLFLENTVGSNSTTQLSNYRVRINVTAPPPNQANQHNCPTSQATPAFVGSGTTNYTPNESLCIPGRGGEPSMRVDTQGTIYVESIRGVPGGLDLWRWYQPVDGPPNADGTLPFKYEGQPDGCGITPFVSKTCGTSGLAPGGGDGDLAFGAPDPANHNIPNLAVVSLSAAEVTASHSTDRADSYSVINPAVATIPFDDRMWLDGFNDPSHVYMEYHDFATTSQIFMQRSADEGETYDNAHGLVISPTLEPAVGPPTGNIAGRPAVDRSSCTSNGNLYQIFVGPDSLTDNSHNSANYLNDVYVGVASGVSLTNPTLSFTDYKVFSCGAGSTCPTGLGLGNLFPSIAVDAFGYVYAVWSDNSTIYYSFSMSHGTTWSRAITVNQGATVGKSNVFPWVAAEANGHVAIAWYGADQSGNSNTLPASTKWNVYVAESVNGHAITPVFTQNLASDHVIHTGTVSTGGLLGNADRSLLDFFQNAIDPTNHLVSLAFDDDHVTPGSAVPVFTRQKKATSGIVTKGKCAGSCHEASGDGDEAGKRGGNAHFNFNHDDCGQQSDNASYNDSDSGVNFQSAHVTSATFDQVAHSVTLTGSGTNNGAPVTFTIVAVDSSLVSPGLFSITLSDGYSNSSNLLDGSITVY